MGRPLIARRIGCGNGINAAVFYDELTCVQTVALIFSGKSFTVERCGLYAARVADCNGYGYTIRSGRIVRGKTHLGTYSVNGGRHGNGF